MKRIPRRIFQEEFKREAIRLVNDQGLTISEACKKLDIATKSLRTWMKQEQAGELKASLGAGKLTADQIRIRELERELSIAKTERDILKKATAYFARESK
jgi:transposase